MIDYRAQDYWKKATHLRSLVTDEARQSYIKYVIASHAKAEEDPYKRTLYNRLLADVTKAA